MSERVTIFDLELTVTLLETSADRCATQEDSDATRRVAAWIRRELDRRTGRS